MSSAPHLRSGWRRSADWALRLTAILTACTAAWIAWTKPTAVNGWLFMDLGTSEATAEWVEKIAAVLLVISAASLIRSTSFLACALITLWMLSLAGARTLQGGEEFSELALASNALRYSAPPALWLLHLKRDRLATLLMRLALASTFAAHGYEALQQHPQFVDLVIPAARQYLGLQLTESEVRGILILIGVVDLAVAVGILLRRSRWILAYMAGWGFITLLSRPLSWGWERWPEAAIRCAHAGVPLALLFYWRACTHLQNKD